MCSALMTQSELDTGQGSIPQAGPEVAERTAQHSEVVNSTANVGRQSDADVPGVG